MLTSQKALLETEYKVKEILNFVLFGSYSSVVSEQPWAADLTRFPDLCRQVSEQFNAAANALDAEIAANLKDKGLI